jgi:hypothetical protein
VLPVFGVTTPESVKVAAYAGIGVSAPTQINVTVSKSEEKRLIDRFIAGPKTKFTFTSFIRLGRVK